MKLLMFEHCSICFRVRMTAALKKLHFQEETVLDDDSDAMIRLTGKRQIPILVMDCGKPMLESMAMVKYLESKGEPIFANNDRPEIAAIAERITPKLAPLTQPRYPLLGLPEFATVAALDHYTMRKRKALGDFVELRANTRPLIRELMPEIEALDALIKAPTAINGQLSLDDILILPLLRSAAVVKI